MRFAPADELGLFAESVRAALGRWEAPREPELGAWLDDRDSALSRRLADAGWAGLAAEPALLPAVVAGGLELGRACAPVCLLDEATLGAPLWIGGRARHGLEAEELAVPLAGGGLAPAAPAGAPVPEPTLDGSGTVSLEVEEGEPLDPAEAAARWRAWDAATLAYLAGLGARALDLAVDHVRSREQFGAPLAALPAVQARLADAALAVDGLTLVAWAAAGDAQEPAAGEAAAVWAVSACCDVTAAAQQVHGAAGFALETGLHRHYRRARALRVWCLAAWEERR